MEFTNNGKVISYLKTIKGGHLVSRLFEIHRHSIQLAFATKATFKSLRAMDRTLNISLTETDTENYPQSGYKYCASAGKYITDDEYENVGYLYTNDFDEANNFFMDLVIKHNQQNNFYSLERYKDHKNNTLKKFDYLTLLMEESKLL